MSKALLDALRRLTADVEVCVPQTLKYNPRLFASWDAARAAIARAEQDGAS